MPPTSSGNAYTRADLIRHLKLYAQSHKAAATGAAASQPLAVFQNAIAVKFHYTNWSMFFRDVHAMSASRFWTLAVNALVAYPVVLTPQQEDAADEAMRSWVREKFTPLIDFAFYDKESSTGFDWPEEDLHQHLQEQFWGRYPEPLIESVARDLERDRGPWGIEDYGRDERDDMDDQGNSASL